MKRINDNKGKLLLLFVRDPRAFFSVHELEYYMSDDETLLGFISFDVEDKNFSAVLLDRNSLNRYQYVESGTDFETIGKARTYLDKLMENYVFDKSILQKKGNVFDLFTQVAKPKEIHPYFKSLTQDVRFIAAKAAIKEISYHYEDIDGNFVDQFQSINGFDARIWELYLFCYFREERFNFKRISHAPDYIIEKDGIEIAIEAVTVQRKDRHFKLDYQEKDINEIQQLLKNDVPLMFGSTLFSKFNKETKYWDLPNVKEKPLLFAIEDFHEDMSMTWSFPAIISILYGIDQEIEVTEDGKKLLKTINDLVFEKNNGTKVSPLFIDNVNENVSAVLFSSTGTLSKFNRMGKQAEYGYALNNLYQIKCCYNHEENAIFPNIVGKMIDENCCEMWSEGVSIFHNPFAKYPLNDGLFLNAAHHHFKDGKLFSQIPNDEHPFYSTTFNIGSTKPLHFNMKSHNTFDDVK